MNAGWIEGEQFIDVPEDSGLVIFATIDFKSGDPYSIGFNIDIYDDDDMFPMPIFSGEYVLSSVLTGTESRRTFLELPAGRYKVVVEPHDRIQHHVTLKGFASDLGPANDLARMNLWWTVFSAVGAIGGIVCIKKGKSRASE